MPNQSNSRCGSIEICNQAQGSGSSFPVVSLDDRQKFDSAADVQPLPPESLKSWLLSIAEVLDFVHSQGDFHRDVKTANMLFDAHGTLT